MTDWRRVRTWARAAALPAPAPAPILILGVPLEDLTRLAPLKRLEDLEPSGAAQWSGAQLAAAALEANRAAWMLQCCSALAESALLEAHREDGWWLRLERGEVLRLRRSGYISRDPHALAFDVWAPEASRVIGCSEDPSVLLAAWLRLTRQADAAWLVAHGREPSAHRYGGATLKSLFALEPEECEDSPRYCPSEPAPEVLEGSEWDLTPERYQRPYSRTA